MASIHELDAKISQLRTRSTDPKDKCLPVAELQLYCSYVIDSLIEEPNILTLSSPLVIVGDIHGQFEDLLTCLTEGGEPSTTRYLFLGDYVDRGHYSLETFTLLLLLKAKFPDRIFMLRGNHESRAITQVYGFYDECLKKYAGDPSVWNECCQVFDHLPLAAIVDGRFFCVHGGISPNGSLDEIRAIERITEIPTRGLFSDLMWSDPEEEVDTWKEGPRGSGYLFGRGAAQEFLRTNQLQIICRSHQLVQEGFKNQWNMVLTIWSAPNYCYRCGNKASIAVIQDSSLSPKIFEAWPKKERFPAPPAPAQYFL